MMLIEDLLWLILSAVVVRAIWRLVDGVIAGMNGQGRSAGRQRASTDGPPVHGVQMVRDPVCGTYIVPDRAASLTDGSRQVFFCSAACRDAYRARAGARSA
jgi:YHS domain-containing protein